MKQNSKNILKQILGQHKITVAYINYPQPEQSCQSKNINFNNPVCGQSQTVIGYVFSLSDTLTDQF